MAGLRAARPDARYAIAWFDAHGDFNTPDTTPSGNVWGMPFAMLCGRGDPDLVAAVDGPTVMEQDAALFGGQVLDETESRMLASSRVAQFGAGMLGTKAGLAAVEGWAGSVATRVDGIYVAFDMDCLDGAEGWGVTYPEPDGLALETAEAVIRVFAAVMPVVGFGPTGVTLANGDGPKTVAGGGAVGRGGLRASLGRHRAQPGTIGGHPHNRARFGQVHHPGLPARRETDRDPERTGVRDHDHVVARLDELAPGRGDPGGQLGRRVRPAANRSRSRRSASRRARSGSSARQSIEGEAFGDPEVRLAPAVIDRDVRDPGPAARWQSRSRAIDGDRLVTMRVPRATVVASSPARSAAAALPAAFSGGSLRPQ